MAEILRVITGSKWGWWPVGRFRLGLVAGCQWSVVSGPKGEVQGFERRGSMALGGVAGGLPWLGVPGW